VNIDSAAVGMNNTFGTKGRNRLADILSVTDKKIVDSYPVSKR
jgi:hypothetical protein